MLIRGLRLAALTRYLKTLLYGVEPHDPATLAAGCAVIVLVALGASLLPARRAVNHDDAASLRAEYALLP